MLCEQSSQAPAGIGRRGHSGTAIVDRPCSCVSVGTPPRRGAIFLRTKAIKQISPAAGLHATLRCRRAAALIQTWKYAFAIDASVCSGTARKKIPHFQSRRNWLRAGWHENFMRTRRAPSVAASESIISALIDRNSACNYCARFERTRRPSENFRLNFCEDDEVILRCIMWPKTLAKRGCEWTLCSEKKN